jgi:D-amino peptidase
MKWMIRCDMEGLSGVIGFDQATPGETGYAFGQRMLMNDLGSVAGA